MWNNPDRPINPGSSDGLDLLNQAVIIGSEILLLTQSTPSVHDSLSIVRTDGHGKMVKERSSHPKKHAR